MNRIEGSFSGCAAFKIYYRYWLPSTGPKAVLVISHGLADHGQRYMNVVDYFVPRGYAVYSLDHRGHGLSEGTRGYVERFSDFTNDLDSFVNIVRGNHPGIKVYLVGHSVGGTIAVANALHHQDKLDGLILSAAFMSVGESVPAALILLARILSRFFPKLGLYTVDASTISRDQSVVDAYMADPLVYRGKIRVRLGMEILGTIGTLRKQLPGITLPVLIMHGTDDRLSEPAGSDILYEELGATDKTYRRYDGFFHEIFNEPDRGQVFSDMETWLDERL
ncbi:MAG: lysophospholipase [Dehalococcoidales bacterium]